MKQLVDILNAALAAKTVNITDLARIAGCSRQSIYNVLQGKQIPTVATAEALAQAVGMSLQLVVSKKSEKIPA